MSNDEARIKLYNLNSSNRQLRAKMVKSLKFTREGEYERASQLLTEARREFEQVKQEQIDLARHSARHRLDSEKTIGFTQVFHDSIAQANQLHARNCSAVKFHIYN